MGDATSRAQELRRLHRDLRVRRYPSLVAHWIGRWFRAPRAAASDAVPEVGAGQVAVTFGGHATVVARYPGLSLAFDPMLGRRVGVARREVAPGISAGDLAGVSVILISHRHADHLHVPTLRQLPRAATVVVPTGGAAPLRALGFARVIELSAGADLELRGAQITAAATAHGGRGRERGVSYVVRGDGPSLYLCGDSGYFSGFAELGRRFAPDIAALPIGGFAPASFRARHMSPLDALYAFEDLRARVLIPIHHGAFALSYERIDEPARCLIELAGQRGVRDHVLVMAPGQTERFVRPSASSSVTSSASSASGEHT